jgi:oligoendopeptidase F
MTLAAPRPDRALTPPERHELPPARTWSLADLYPSDDAWRAAKAALVAALPEAEHGRGTLADSPQALRAALDALMALHRELLRLHSYASMRSDEDLRLSAPLAMKQEIALVANDLAARSAWLEPEILAMTRSTVEAHVAAEPGLAVYRHYLDDLLRRQAHTGSAEAERILADAGLMADGPVAIHELLVDADLPRPEVTLSTGETVALDPSSFARWRGVPDRDDRRRVFEAYFGRLHEFRRTLGATLDANVKRDVFFARARRYGSALERALDGFAIPVTVYEGLVAQANAHLGTFHRYLELRRRILGLEQLHAHDLYAALLPEVELRFTVEEAERHVLASCAPLGADYQAVVARAFAERWIDFLPAAGKRSGAYSNGVAYDVHPYILMNFNGKYDDVSTLAHELGHTLHSYLSNRDQPFATSRYSIFVAEVASTFNEALLLDHMLATHDEPKVRLSLLGNFLEGIKGTVFRQTQFAEFELEIHRAVERGEALTGDSLDALYLAIARRYYGHEAGVCVVDDVMRAEWSFVPHFYYDFYVYQYATAFTASSALAERVLAGDGEARQSYLELLSAGGSDYPIELLRRAGVDLTTPEPFAATMRRAERVMDEIEGLLAGSAR